jgi:predicted TPR repeat methyltransferase
MKLKQKSLTRKSRDIFSLLLSFIADGFRELWGLIRNTKNSADYFLKPKESNLKAAKRMADMGLLADAELRYRVAAYFDPDNEDIEYNLGVLRMAMKKFAKAKQNFEKINSAEAKYFLKVINDEEPQDIPFSLNERFYDNIAANYEKYLAQIEYIIPDIMLKNTKKMMEIPKNGIKILDIGCGSGIIGHKMRSIASYLQGIDISKNMLKIAGEKYAYDGISKTYDNLQNVNLANFQPSEKFDLIIASESIFSVQMLDIFVEFCKKHLHDKAFVFATFRISEIDFNFIDQYHAHAFSKDFLLQKLEIFEPEISIIAYGQKSEETRFFVVLRPQIRLSTDLST